jgi:hypothetical protein
MDHLSDHGLFALLAHYDKCKCDKCQYRVNEIKELMKKRDLNG